MDKELGVWIMGAAEFSRFYRLAYELHDEVTLRWLFGEQVRVQDEPTEKGS